MPPTSHPSDYAKARLQIITAEMRVLDLCARRYETAFAAADGNVGEEFQEAWDGAIADWWVLAEEAEALSADLEKSSLAMAGIAEALARMISVSLPGPC